MCVWKTLIKSKNIFCFFLVFLSGLFSSRIKRKPKKISRSSFACWELFYVNSFSRFRFFFLQKNKNSKNISVCFFEIIFFSLGVDGISPRWKCWGSNMHYCWSNKEPILPCLLLWINVCGFQLSPMHMHYYYYPHCSVVQVKGNKDNIWWNDWDEEKLVWTRPIWFLLIWLVHHSRLSLLWMKHVCNDN